MVSATQLSGYLYCPRKLFIGSVLMVEEAPKVELVKGRIWHKTFEELNNSDEKIVKSIKSKDYKEIFDIYRQAYAKILRNVIIKNKSDLQNFGVKLIDMFKDYWPSFENEAKRRALNIANFLSKKEIYGAELWELLTPKIKSEQYLKSENLKLSGIIDTIEIHGKEYIPVEMKTGKVPDKGMWDGHRVQLASYIMLLNDAGFDAKEGILRYRDTDDRILAMNSLLRDEVLELIRKVNEITSGLDIPDFVDNRNKCKSCSFRDTCYNVEEMNRLLLEAKTRLSS